MKILMICVQFPPILDPESLCAGKLSQALTESGVDLTVVTMQVMSYHQSAPSPCWNRAMGTVIRLPPPWYPRRLASLAAKLYYQDRSTSWFLHAAYQYCRRLLREKSFDLVITRSLPMDALMVGYYLHREFPFRWAATISDPYPACLLPKPYGDGYPSSFAHRHQIGLARMALAQADLIAFPSARLGHYQESKLGISFGDRTLTLPHIGWKREAVEPVPEQLEILHAGGLGMPRVTPRLFQLVRQRLRSYPELEKKLKFTFLGFVHPSFKEFVAANRMDSMFQFEDAIPFEECLSRMSRATALLLMEAPFEEGIFLPSKFCDYAASGTPLLMFSPERGTISDLVGGYQHPGFLGQNQEKLPAVIDRFLTRLQERQSLKDYAYPRPHDFDSDRIARELLSRISSGK